MIISYERFAPHLEVRTEGPLRFVTLNRPDRLNAVNDELHEALVQVWQALAADDGARAVILTGAGRAFSAGGDQKDLGRTTTAWHSRHSTDGAQRLVLEMIRCPLPLVAAVNGPAVGLGATLAICCDIVFISAKAHISDPHVTVGLVAGDGGAALWPIFASPPRAKEFLFTGDRVSPELAVQLNLANRVVAPEALIDEATAFATRLTEQPRAALLDTKRAVNMHIERAISGVLEFSATAERESLRSDEHKEAVERIFNSAG